MSWPLLTHGSCSYRLRIGWTLHLFWCSMSHHRGKSGDLTSHPDIFYDQLSEASGQVGYQDSNKLKKTSKGLELALRRQGLSQESRPSRKCEQIKKPNMQTGIQNSPQVQEHKEFPLQNGNTSLGCCGDQMSTMAEHVAKSCLALSENSTNGYYRYWGCCWCYK